MTQGEGSYGFDIKQLKFTIEYQTEYRVRILITDVEEKRAGCSIHDAQF
jgi:hypothetical protein